MGININFDNWIISPGKDTLAYQRDHKSRVLLVSGDLPEGWSWSMLVNCQGHDNTITLLPMEGGIGVELTRDDLAFGNCQYDMQIRGAKGGVERHTNKIQVYIPASLSGCGDWPTIPTEFTQAEAWMRELLAQGQEAESNAAASAQTAQDAAEAAGLARDAAQGSKTAAVSAAEQAREAAQEVSQNLQAVNAAKDAAQTAAGNAALSETAAGKSAAAAGASAQAAADAKAGAETAGGAVQAAKAAAENAAANAQASAGAIQAAAEQISKNAADIASAAPGIVETAEGEIITLADASDKPLQGLVIYGKTTQDGTPTPENPVELVSVGDNGSIGVSVTDGADGVQSMIFATPNGLPGIPVASGGNYTDADGQQWVCDEVDLTRGVYVHRIKSLQFNGSENWEKNANGVAYLITGLDAYVFPPKSVVGNLRSNQYVPQSYDKLYGASVDYCISAGATNNDRLLVRDSRFESADSFKSYLASNPLEVMYQLADPTEIPIPADELAAYAAMHTNQPNTTIYNDSGAHMAVQYVADTDTYISNNYVPKAAYDALEKRIAALEQKEV